MKVAIIDYQLSNLFSVKHAFDYLKIDSEITSDKLIISKCNAAILPGVGAFGDAMNNLKQLDLIDLIKEFVSAGKPFMGVCLGMQLLFSQSEEFGIHKGLDLIKGKVKKFANENKTIKVPQIGWNQIFQVKQSWGNSPLKETKNNSFMYFIHSYHVLPEDQNVVLSSTIYEDVEYCSSLLSKNLFATQFHPEKSGPEGIKIYENWITRR